MVQTIADLHIHSRFSRACSKDITINNLEKYAKMKGLGLMGTGDCTHPLWVKELKETLIDDGTGFLKSKDEFPFVLSAEVSNMYPQGNKARKVHQVLLVKNFEILDQMNRFLSTKGKLASDGRPIFGRYPCDAMVEDLKKIDDSIEIIPAHVWTPWFGLFGSMSGFDSVKECYKDQTKNIFALETGLSSDPEMNWRISENDRFALVSNSDSHSFWPWRIGREATIFDIKMNYGELIKAIRTKKGLVGTIEVDPNYGKYHFDGHRNCNIVYSPKESIKHNNICPVCKRKLTIGVLHRVDEIANREEGFIPKDAPIVYKFVSLHEIISLMNGKAVASKQTWETYSKMIARFGNEFEILMNTNEVEIKSAAGEELADAIMLNRKGMIKVSPGYDGEYGIPEIGNKKLKSEDPEKFKEKTKEKPKQKLAGQKSLSEY